MPKTKEQKELESKFDKLAEQLRRGWAKTHPLTEKEMSVVRDAVREQWNQEQKTKSQAKENTGKHQAKKQTQHKSAQQKKDKPQGHGHNFGHSH